MQELTVACCTTIFATRPAQLGTSPSPAASSTSTAAPTQLRLSSPPARATISKPSPLSGVRALKTFIKHPLHSYLPLLRPHHACRAARLPSPEPELEDGAARQDGLRRDEPGTLLAAAVAARQAGLLRAQPGRLAPGRPPPPALRRRGENVARRRLHARRLAAPLPPLPPPLGRRRAPLPGVLHGPPPLLRPAPLRRRRRGERRGVAQARRTRRQRRGQRRGRRRGGGVHARRAGLAVEVLRARGVRVLCRVRVLPARALGRQQVLQASRRRQERGVRVVPHPGRHGPDGRPHEDDVGQRHGPPALPQPRHLLQPARQRHVIPPLLRRPHRRLRGDAGVLPAAEERARGDGVRGGEAGPALRRGREPAQQAQQRPARPGGGARQTRLRAARARPHPRPPRQVQVLPPRSLQPPHPRGTSRQACAPRRRRLPIPRRQMTTLCPTVCNLGGVHRPG